ncbi:ArsR/SmtB family transcription factor [Verrucomicrobiota bacterium]
MDQVLAVAKALSDSNRLKIVLALLEYDELCACQITELLQVTGATASRHLALLVAAGLLASRKEGRWVYYKLNAETIAEPVLNWISGTLAGSAELSAVSAALKEIAAADPEELCRKQRGDACCPGK